VAFAVEQRILEGALEALVKLDAGKRAGGLALAYAGHAESVAQAKRPGASQRWLGVDRIRPRRSGFRGPDLGPPIANRPLRRSRGRCAPTDPFPSRKIYRTQRASSPPPRCLRRSYRPLLRCWPA